MDRKEAQEMLNFMGTREDAAKNNCAQDWDEAWEIAFRDDAPVHFDLAGRDFTL